MAQTLEQIIETHLKVIDAASGPLARIAAQAEKAAGGLDKTKRAASHAGEAGGGAFSTLFNALKGMAGIGAVVGTALSLHGAIESTEKYMGQLKEVSELTGATVSQTDFLFSSARRAGVEYDVMSQTMFKLSRRGAMMATTMAAAGGKVPGMAKKFAALGVDMKKGPVASLEAMSAAVKANKIGASELMAQFQIPQKAANDMEGFLRGLDPKKLAAIKKSGGKGLGLVDDSTMNAFKAIESAQHRINDTWNRIKVTVISKLYPIVAKMAEGFADKLEGALPKITAAMDWVAANMDRIVVAAKIFVATMTAKKMFDMVSSLASPGGLVGKIASQGLAGALGGGGAGMAGIASQISMISTAFGALLPIAIAVAAVIALVYLGFKAFDKNVKGIGDAIRLHIDTIVARFELIWESLSQLGAQITGMFGEGGGLGDVLGYIAAFSFDAVLQGFDFFVHILQTVASLSVELGEMFQWLWKDVLHDLWIEYVQNPFLVSMKAIGRGVGLVVDFLVDQYNTIVKFWGGAAMQKGGFKLDFGWLEAPIALFKKHWDKTQIQASGKVATNRAAEAKEKKKSEDAKPPKTEMNFPNARFDITQNFAEGFDPDRIAVAFANDLSSLGEMGSSSTFAPIAAVR